MRQRYKQLQRWWLGHKRGFTQDEVLPVVDNIEQRLQRLENIMALPTYGNQNRDISSEQIDTFVDQLLAEPAINLGWLPDVMERRMDRRIIELMLGAMDKALASASITIADGHVLTMSLHPSPIYSSPVMVPNDTAASVPPLKPVEHGTLDSIMFTALGSLLGTMRVELMGHEIHFHLK